MRILAPLLLLLAACDFDVSPGGSAQPPGGGPATVFFSLDVLPIFQADCIHCHGGAGGLDLESYQGVMQGGLSGPAVNVADPDQSLLILRLNGSILPQMPADGGPLPGPEIDRIREWIAQGAVDN